MEIIGIKYLKYEIEKQSIDGINHKRSCLSYLLADSIIENKIPVIHKSKLASHYGMRTDQEFISTYMIGDYYKIPYKFVARRLGDAASVVADNSLAINLLDWSPKRSLEEMCIDGWKWQRANPYGF